MQHPKILASIGLKYVCPKTLCSSFSPTICGLILCIVRILSGTWQKKEQKQRAID